MTSRCFETVSGLFVVCFRASFYSILNTGSRRLTAPFDESQASLLLVVPSTSRMHELVKGKEPGTALIML